MRSLNAGKSPGVANILSELLKNGGEATATVLTAICKTREWAKEWTQALVTHLPKKGNPEECQNYRIISLTSQIITAISISQLSSTDSKSRLRNCWQKNKPVIDQAGAQ